VQTYVQLVTSKAIVMALLDSHGHVMMIIMVELLIEAVDWMLPLLLLLLQLGVLVDEELH